MDNETLNVEYKEFIVDNRVKVNRYLNTVLWFFVITGPAIAAGVAAGVFDYLSYSTCASISVIVILLASFHMLLLKKIPDSRMTSIFALTALDILIVYMSYSHVSIYLTWFLVPLLSLLFCDKTLFFYSTVLNYVLMFTTTLITSPYYADMRTDYDTMGAYFADTIGGFTIETVIMSASAYAIGRLTSDYYRELFRQYRVIREQDENMNEKMNILDSMVEIYDNVNLIDFVENTETSLRSPEKTKRGIDINTQTHTLMNQKLKNKVMPGQVEAFLTFTNIKTLKARLSQRKIISADFIDVESGWFRAQYITVDSSEDGFPKTVIYVTRNVDEEKKREENLIRISKTDEMTRLYNRRCYEEDLNEYRNKVIEDDLVLLSVDVNGLKKVNDTKGHAAGDELIKGSADCLVMSVGTRGKVYRTGGDEFIVVAHSGDPEEICRDIREKAESWRGEFNDKLSVSVGYAARKDNPTASIDELEHISDANMYAEKERYYKENGIERRA